MSTKTRTYHSKTKARNSVTRTHKTTYGKHGTTRTSTTKRNVNGHCTTTSRRSYTKKRR